MSHLAISELLKGNVAVDSQVTVKGWIRTRRDSKAGISFLAVHDGSCFDPIQAVVPNSLNNYDEVTSLTAGCSVSVTGVLVQSAGKGQSFEIQANSVTVLGWVENPDSYPMAAKRHSIEYLREHAHLRPRTNMIGAVTTSKAFTGSVPQSSQPVTVKAQVKCSAYQHLICKTCHALIKATLITAKTFLVKKPF